MSASAETSIELKERPMDRLPIPERHAGPLRTPSTDRQLNRRQLLFINYYIQGDSPTVAARRAGYAESVAKMAATTILKSPLVYKEINQRTREEFKRLELDADWILGQLGIIASANHFDYGYIDEKGRFIVDLKNVDRFQASAIQEISFDNNGNQKIKLYDKNAAQEKIMRMQGIDKSSSMSGSDKQPITIQSLDNIVNKVTINQTINQQINIQERQQIPGGRVIEQLNP